MNSLDQGKIGLLSNKPKQMKDSSTRSDQVEDIELQDIDKNNNYVSFEDGQKQVKFQKQIKQAPQTLKPSNHDSEILFNPDNQNPESNIQAMRVRPDQQPNQQYNRYPTMSSNANNYQSQPQNQNNYQSMNASNGLARQQSLQQQPSLTVVTCTICSSQQQVGDINSAFQCFRCRQLVTPIFTQFRCGCCSVLVMFQVGISQIIKCTRCNTVNYIPNPNMMQQGNQMQQSNQQINQMQQSNSNQQQNLQQQQQQQQQFFQQPQFQSQNRQDPSLRPPPAQLLDASEVILEGDSEYVQMNTTVPSKNTQNYQSQNKDL